MGRNDGLTDGPGAASPPHRLDQGWCAVIVVTRFNGGVFGVNPDLVQRIDSAPDTILTLIDGTKLIVAESMDEVIARVNEHRARILARSRELQILAAESARAIRPVPGDDDPEPEPDDRVPNGGGQLRRVR